MSLTLCLEVSFQFYVILGLFKLLNFIPGTSIGDILLISSLGEREEKLGERFDSFFWNLCQALHYIDCHRDLGRGDHHCPEPPRFGPHIQTWNKDGSCVKNSRKQASMRRERHRQRQNRGSRTLMGTE